MSLTDYILLYISYQYWNRNFV